MKLKYYLLIIILFISACSHAKEQCLIFVEGKDKNKVNEYLEKHGFRKSIVDMGSFFSSSYDLNGDGKLEFFYYFEGLTFCGNQTGCSIHINEYLGNRFISRVYPSIHPFGKFNPQNVSHKNYICILDAKTNGWEDLKIDDRYVIKFDGEVYK